MRSAILIVILATRVAHGDPRVQLSADEEQLLDEGLISGERIAGGVVVAATAGFGAGQAVEGRWGSTGYLFAIGDGLWTAGLIGIVANHGQLCGGASKHCDGWDQLVPWDLLLMTAVRALEIVDASIGPSRHNRRVREVRAKLGQPLDDEARLVPFVVPTGDGVSAGVSVRF